MEKVEISPVSEAMAKLVIEQCIGEYPGHMASIPHNPMLKAMFQSHVPGHRDMDVNQFAEALRQVANHLSPL